MGITNLTDFELRPIEQQDINYDEAVNMFNSSRSMVTNNNRNSSVSMVDHNRTAIGAISTISDFQKDKSTNLLTSNLKDKVQAENNEKVFAETLSGEKLKSDFIKNTVKVFPQDSSGKKTTSPKT